MAIELSGIAKDVRIWLEQNGFAGLSEAEQRRVLDEAEARFGLDSDQITAALGRVEELAVDPDVAAQVASSRGGSLRGATPTEALPVAGRALTGQLEVNPLKSLASCHPQTPAVVERVLNDQPAHLFAFGSLEANLERSVENMLLLQPEVVPLALNKTFAAMVERTLGEAPGPDLDPQTVIARLTARHDELLAAGERDEAFMTLLRLSSAKDRVDAWLDEDTGEVRLVERSGELHKAVPQPDVGINKPLLAEMASSPAAVAGLEETGLLAGLAESLPPNVVAVLHQAGIRMELVEPGECPALLGERMDPELGRLRFWGGFAAEERVAGRYIPEHGLVALVRGDHTRHHFRETDVTNLTHELMHALDTVLASIGEGCISELPRWQQIYESTLASVVNQDGQQAFPNAYAASSPSEFFAEAATMYLRPHISNSSDNAQVTTRSDLKLLNEPAHQFMEEVFSELVPKALGSGELQTPDHAAMRNDILVEHLTEHPPAPDDPQGWYDFGTCLLHHALSARSAVHAHMARRALEIGQAAATQNAEPGALRLTTTDRAAFEAKLAMASNASALLEE